MNRKLDIGCGHRARKGYDGADIRDHGQRYVCDIRSLPIPDDTYEEVMAIHVIEHFPSWQAPDAMREWVRVLKPGGKLVIECPDLLKACALTLLGATGCDSIPKALTLGAFWGDQSGRDEYMIHKWGYSPGTLRALMEEVGLFDIAQEPIQFHQPLRDMRLVGTKQ